MFRITRRTDYAIRVVLCLAKQPANTRLATETIQNEMLIPRPFLRRIVADLSRAGLVHTFPGPGGGLELAHSPKDINLRHIWEAIEGPLLISDCLKAAGECPFDTQCPVRCRWARIQALLIHELEEATLEILAPEALQQEIAIPLRKFLPIEENKV